MNTDGDWRVEQHPFAGKSGPESGRLATWCLRGRRLANIRLDSKGSPGISLTSRLRGPYDSSNLTHPGLLHSLRQRGLSGVAPETATPGTARGQGPGDFLTQALSVDSQRVFERPRLAGRLCGRTPRTGATVLSGTLTAPLLAGFDFHAAAGGVYSRH